MEHSRAGSSQRARIWPGLALLGSYFGTGGVGSRPWMGSWRPIKDAVDPRDSICSPHDSPWTSRSGSTLAQRWLNFFAHLPKMDRPDTWAPTDAQRTVPHRNRKGNATLEQTGPPST
ncbi:hypothetical protein BGZ63DRAFT_401491 [Mariannaea sp. PMI_226]|nr:hypothetical protein BGZ63DRAFT_401491 [Mariannaea sp. PMI_226]